MTDNLLAVYQRPPADAEFLRIFNRLAVALRDAQDDTGTTQGVYFEALRDLPVSALEATAQALMREPGRRFFPTTAEWRTAAVEAQRAQLREIVKPAREEGWRLECGACEDTGWVYHQCTGQPGTATCGREHQGAKYAHEFVTVCGCRATNRTWLRHHGPRA